MDAVRGTIKFAIATGRLEREVEQAAAFASVASNRTLNSWRNEPQAHLLLIIHGTSLNKAIVGIGKYSRRKFDMDCRRQ